ncbi:MAG: choice-of-anchor I family protein [Bacteroidota bacterium]|nr:choice-of-anchor I family protein [Bacteroidota bacterium]
MKKFLFSLFAGSIYSLAISQTTITHWDFNSNPNDATTGTGTLLPETGAGTITTLGGITTTFAAGNPSDVNTTDNSGYNTSTYPAQSTNQKTAGIQIDVNTTGLQNIGIEFQQRLSNTAANTWVLQYTSDVTAGSPVWVDAQTFTFIPAATGTGDTWHFRTFNLTSVTALNNNPNVAFRIVSDFDQIAGQYLAARSTSTYSTAGTSRFDLVKIQSLPTVLPYTLAFLKSDKTVSEDAGTAKVWLKVTTAGNTTGSVDLSLSNYSNADATDLTIASTTIPVSDTLVVNDTIAFSITINDDAVNESDEYLICKLSNGVNVNFAATAQHTLYIKDNDRMAPVATNQLNFNLLGSFNNGAPASNSAEISAYDVMSKRIFIANSIGSKLDIVNFSNPASPVLINSIDVTPYGAINSVAVKNGLVALAIENSINRQDSGKVVFLDTNGILISQVVVGILPDMITFNHNGTKVYTANEAEPSDDYTNDPDGSVSIIDISGGAASITSSNVSHITFTSFNGQETTLRSQGIRIYGISGMASKDFEPEYITISDDDSKAWVTLQENNALAELDLINNTVVRLIPLGTKDHNLVANALDASNSTSDVNLSNFPVKGMYLPDAIAHYTNGSNLYLLTANEGDSRAWTGMNEETTIGSGSYILDPTLFPNATDLKNNSVLGKLKTTNKLGDIDNDGDFDEIYVYGSRSFSIWDANAATLIYDSGDDFERITSTHLTYSSMFNASNGSGITKKDRSDDKGPEPEGVATGSINGHEYAFIALERIGGVMIYDITNPLLPAYVGYANNRGPDRGAEGIIFIPSSESPNGKNLVILSNETSSTLTIFEVNPCLASGLANVANNSSLNFCAGDSVKLYNSNSISTNVYQWMMNGTAINNATDSIYYAVQAGNYSLFAYNASGCENTSSIVNTQTASLPFFALIANGSTTFCDTDSLLLSDVNNNSYTYQWIDANGNITNATDTSLMIFNSGMYALIATNNGICSDTSSYTTVTVNGSPAAPSISQTGFDFNCTSTGVQYQWYFNGTIISGATSQNYTATQNGIYAVEITDGNTCTSMSSDIIINTIGLSKNISINSISVYPNPNEGKLDILINTEKKETVNISLYDLMGKKIAVIANNLLVNSRESIHYSIPTVLTNGVYFIKVVSPTFEKTERIILQR